MKYYFNAGILALFLAFWIIETVKDPKPAGFVCAGFFLFMLIIYLRYVKPKNQKK